MKRIVILGCSAAGVEVIDGVRQWDSSSETTLIVFDGHYPYRRDMFAPFIAGEISREKVFCRPKDFYAQHKVNAVLEQKISRINVRRKKIFTDEKTQVDYDVLIVTDTPENRFPDIKGVNKTGVFGYKKFRDIEQMVNALLPVDTVAVQSDTFSGLQAAAAFAKRGKEVILISSENDFFGRHFEAETISWLVSRFEEKGVRIMRAGQIAEILGDKDAKAVRLESGKVFAAQIVLFGETEEDFRLFFDGGFRFNKKMGVNDRFETNISGVFAVDQVCGVNGCEPVTPLPVLEEQGRTVAAAINGRDHAVYLPPCSWDLDMEGLSVTVLGETGVRERTEVRRAFEREAGRYKGLYMESGYPVGAVLVNAADEKERFLRLILENISPAFVDNKGG